jgi:hypothetical protein
MVRGVIMSITEASSISFKNGLKAHAQDLMVASFIDALKDVSHRFGNNSFKAADTGKEIFEEFIDLLSEAVSDSSWTCNKKACEEISMHYGVKRDAMVVEDLPDMNYAEFKIVIEEALCRNAYIIFYDLAYCLPVEQEELQCLVDGVLADNESTPLAEIFAAFANADLSDVNLGKIVMALMNFVREIKMKRCP